MSDNPELDVINHLLEVEKNASGVIDSAKAEADKRITEAKAKYNQEYKAKYDALSSEKEKAFQEKVASLEENHKSAVEDFKKSLETKPQNQEQFNKLLDSLLFAKA